MNDSYLQAGPCLWQAPACFHGNRSHKVTENGKYLAPLCKSCVFHFPQEPATPPAFLQRVSKLSGFLEMHGSGENHPQWRHMSSHHGFLFRGRMSIRANPKLQRKMMLNSEKGSNFYHEEKNACSWKQVLHRHAYSTFWERLLVSMSGSEIPCCCLPVMPWACPLVLSILQRSSCLGHS